MDKKPAPHYQIAYNIHLPKDPPWRLENRNKRRIATSSSSIDAARGAFVDILELLGLETDTLVVGVLLEIIQGLPEHVREVLVSGIIDGLGLNISIRGGKIAASIDPKYLPLALGQERTLASGLIVPPPAASQIVVPGGPNVDDAGSQQATPSRRNRRSRNVRSSVGG